MRHTALFIAISIVAGCSKSEQREIPTETVTLRFSVEGMTCEGCAASITHTIKGMDGVADCTVSFEDGTAVVDAASADTGSTIAAAFEGTGFVLRAGTNGGDRDGNGGENANGNGDGDGDTGTGTGTGTDKAT